MPLKRKQPECTETSSKKANIEEVDGSPTDKVCVKRSRTWAFTSKSSNVILTKKLKDMNVHVFSGPSEKTDHLDGLAHGVIIFRSTIENKQCSAIRKNTVAKILQEFGVILEDNYLQPTTDLVKYVEYMYKTSEEGPPVDLLNLLPKNATAAVDFKHEMIKELYEEFDSKPSYNIWKKLCIDKLGITIAENIVSRSYKQWPMSRNKDVLKLKKIAEKLATATITRDELNEWISTVFGKSITSVKYKNKLYGQTELTISLLCAALEARVGEIAYAPHILFYGNAGTGKSLIAQTLFGEEVSSSMPNDAEGVGCLEIDTGKVVFRVDDASTKLWENSGVLASIKEMYHAKWSAKIHSTKQINDPCCCVITTNNHNPMADLMKVDDKEAWERRFIMVDFHEKPISFGKRKKITQDVRDEFFIMLLKSFVRDLRGHLEKKEYELQDDFILMFDKLCEYVDALNECDSDDE